MGIKLKRRGGLVTVLVAALLCFPIIPAAFGQATIPAATFELDDQVTDTSALLPLNDWVPLFLFSIDTGDPTGDSIAPRYLTQLIYTLKDDTKAADRSYDILSLLLKSDLLQMAIFEEGNPTAEVGALDDKDHILVGRAGTSVAGLPCVFDMNGRLLADQSKQLATKPLPLKFVLGDDTIGGLLAQFIRVDPFTLPRPPHADDDGKQTYVVAIRTSQTWRNAVTLAYQVDDARMRMFNGGYPLNDDGTPLDSYPDFPFDPGTAYSSSFGAWDCTGGPSTNVFNSEFGNSWTYPRFLYTPLAEFSRPRFDVTGSVFDYVAGQFLDLRRIIPLDAWTPVIGIDLHGTASPNDGASVPSAKNAILKEVNVILTDIGGDPLGAAGNGGFNPTNGLETFTNNATSGAGGGEFDGDTAINRDFSFNGCWVFYDTNGNGAFDPPTYNAGGGVTFVDHPMFPEGVLGPDLPENPDDRNPGLARWEYIPFPPGGGDPWWKIRLRLSDFGRRQDTPFPDPPSGWLGGTPNGNRDDYATSTYDDFFVVVRPDSGYKDASALPGDGVGLTYGADFRAFIEPRRFNATSATEDGGIFVQSQIPTDSFILEGTYLSDAWQDDSLWGASEPWWPQRTLNATNAKPVRTTVEIHDLVINYETNNLYAKVTDNAYGYGMYFGDGIFSTNTNFFPNFSRWLDPLGLTASQFADVHAVGVRQWSTEIGGVEDEVFGTNQYPYETVPFFQADNDLPPYGPRSAFFPTPPAQPTLPDYTTWPASLDPGEYPHESQWSIGNRKARYLKQHIESKSRPTAMIGINMTAADDPITNALAQIRMQQITVAFWGPDFTPSDLLTLDPNGTSSSSGVMLVEDGVPASDSTVTPIPYTAQNGVFGPTLGVANELSLDTPVPVTNLAWRSKAEYIDLDGDGNADDMNGDNVVDNKDKAWVLRLRPSTPWKLPTIDAAGGHYPGAVDTGGGGTGGGDTGGGAGEGAGGDGKAALGVTSINAQGLTTVNREIDVENGAVPAVGAKSNGTSYFAKVPIQTTEAQTIANEERALSADGAKSFGPAGNAGDDLFVVVRTSSTIRRFEQFRCVVPSTLPERAAADRPAGLQLVPQTPISLNVYSKSQPEEGPVPYYGPSPFGYDMIEANIAGEIDNLTSSNQSITKDSDGVAVLGLDLSTNRGSAGIAAQGTTGTGGAASFTVSTAAWTPGAFVGFYLIDSKYEQFPIVANTAKALTLDVPSNASGTPHSGAWIIAKDPSFLEQVIVEFYDQDNDGGFNLIDDLKDFDADGSISGIAIYRDNDNSPSNKNGVFDETDIPITLDMPPYQIGQAGEVENQVLMVFSTPGTDNVPTTLANQTRHRQWNPDSFGTGQNDPNKGDDFFIVIRTSSDIKIGDDFRVGIASWGPNTPTEPDPDTFPPPPAARTGEFDVFSEFPWGQRAVGLISIMTADKYYKQYPETDNSGFSWVRSNLNKSVQTAKITTTDEIIEPDQLVITNAVPKTVPQNVTGGGLTMTITGANFGSSPTAVFDGITLTIISSTSTSIVATIPGGSTIDTDGDGSVTLKVTDPSTGNSDTYSNFTVDTSGTGGGNAPVILTINPSQGSKNDFPITITGQHFKEPKVLFEGVNMPIQGTPTATKIIVGFPVGGLPFTGKLDVTVKNKNGLQAVKADGFTYVNSPTGGNGGGGFGGGGGTPSPCFIATAAYGSPFAAHLDSFRAFRDGVLLKTAPGTAVVDLYYTISPALADRVAQSPTLAFVVRLVLTPVAWAIESPIGFGVAVLAVVGLWMAFRQRRRLVRHACRQ